AAGSDVIAAGSDLPAGDAEADPETLARTICLRLLTASARTRSQLAEALQRRQVPAEAAEAVLDRLAEVGLIDDAAYAGSWVAGRSGARGLGRRALTAELRRRGVAAETVAETVAGLSADDELATARDLVHRRLRGMAGLPPDVRHRRLLGMLARRGFPAGVSARAIREALAGPHGLADGDGTGS
ncbi:MAG TPA: regulatory protein RecX, partial [Mycobacteriales bacterium]|nr:regulatory protein RecX [Mycobacteriales bacterium]